MDKLIPLAFAAKEFGVSHNYLCFLIFKKKLKAVKREEVWYTSREWVREYFQSITPRKFKGNQLNNNDDISNQEFPQENFSTRLVSIENNLSEMRKEFKEIVSYISEKERVEKAETKTETVKYTLPSNSRLEIKLPSIAPGNFTKYNSFLILALLLFLTFGTLVMNYPSSLSLPSLPSFSLSNLELPSFSELSSFGEGFSSVFLNTFASLSVNSAKNLNNLFVFSLPEFKLPKLSLPSLTSLKNVILSKAKNLTELFSSPPLPPSEISIPRKSQINADSNADTHGKKSYEVEPRKISEPHELSETLHEVEPREVSKETIRIREVVEHQEKIIPADATLVKQDILTEVENINKSLRERFENALNDLTLKLSRTTVSTDSNTRIITLTQKIDQLSNTTFSNATFQGTANQFNLRDTDIPDDITVTGTISPSQLTVSNTLTVSGTGTSTYQGGIQASTINLTSTTATSTFSNGIQLGGGVL